MTKIDQPLLVRAGVMQGVEAAIEKLGGRPQPILAEVGFSADVFRQGDHLLHVNDLFRLLEHCARATNTPQFCLVLAQMQDLSFLGDLGLLIQTAPSLGEALKVLPRYVHIHAQPATWAMEQDQEVTTVSFSLDVVGASAVHRMLCVELALAQCYRILQLLTQGRIRPTEITLCTDEVADRPIYAEYFGCPVRFGDEVNSLVLSNSFLDQSVSHSNPELHALVQERIELSGSYYQGMTLSKHIKNIIRTLLADQNCSVEVVAKIAGFDKRSLQRALQRDGGLCYQELLDEVRFDQAQFYLKETNIPLAQLAHRLGFSEASNLSRAFRRRFGCPPRQWRVENQSNSVRRNAAVLR